MNGTMEAFILGLLQGTAEFLPISSSGHLIIASWLMGGKTLPLTMNIALHVGTLFAVLLYFWKDWLALAKALWLRLTKSQKSFESDVLFPALVLGCVPAGIVGVLWEHDIERIFHHPQFVIFPLAVVGFVIWWGDRKAQSHKDMGAMTVRDALLIGVAQTMALIPGVSRSGSTILGARLLSYRKDAAARFSFLLGTPVMLGAVVLNAKDILVSAAHPEFWVGSVTALVTGCFAIGFLLRFIQKFGFGLFAFYRLALALVILVWVM